MPETKGPIAVPGLVITGLFLTLLAGDTAVAGIDLRVVGGAGVLFGALMLGGVPSLPAARHRSLFVGAFVAWLTLLVLSSAWAPLEARVNGALLSLAAMAVTVLGMAFIVRRVPDRALRWWWWLLYGSSVIYTFGGLALGTLSAQGRLTVFGTGANIYGRVVALGVVAALALVYGGRRSWMVFVPVPAMLVAVLLSGSRGALLSLVVALLVAVWLASRHSPPRQRRALWLLIAFAGAAFARWGWPLVSEMVQTRIIQASIVDRYSSGRNVIAQEALKLIEAHPFVGVGLDGFWGESGRTFGAQYPHNLILETAVDAGVVAVLLLLIALGAGFRSAYMAGRVRENIGAIAALFMLVSAMFSGSLYDSRFLWAFLLVGAEEVARARWRQEHGLDAAPADRERVRREEREARAKRRRQARARASVRA